MDLATTNNGLENIQEAKKMVEKLNNELDRETKKRKAIQALVESVNENRENDPFVVGLADKSNPYIPKANLPLGLGQCLSFNQPAEN